MTVRTVTNLPAVTHGETMRCLFAIELSTMSWVVAFNTPLSEKISRRTLTGCKWKRLLELIEEVRARRATAASRAGPFGLGTRSACQPDQGALRAPRHLRLQSVTPAGDGTAGAIAHDARRRIAAAAKIRDQAGIAASGACG